MKISIITPFPALYDHFLKTSLVARAQKNEIITISLFAFSDVCQPGERIDESICGPGTGMVIKPEVVERAIGKVEKERGKGYRIFFSPQGKVLNQPILRQLAAKSVKVTNLSSAARSKRMPGEERIDHLILICARYEGMDDRVEQYYADLVLSIGDYVLMGGDVPALVFLEGFLRLIPCVVGKSASVAHDSFMGPFLDYPAYGLPVSWKEREVPDVILSGNHAAITAWRTQKAVQKTILKRFDWFSQSPSTPVQREAVHKMIPPHYLALMHTQVLVKQGSVGETSVTSLDIHDSARSAATYGIENVFVVTPLKDQQKIVSTFLRFWRSKEGKEYNESRFRAVSRVVSLASLDETIKCIADKHGAQPLIIATSAREIAHEKNIDYTSQGEVWRRNRPVLFLFGTGQGMAKELIDRADYLLDPIIGLSDYNHLSVRAAISITLDRWLGIKPRRELSVDSSS